MKKFIDAEGMEMTAFYKGDSSLEVIERDDGYIDVADGKKWYLSDYKNWSGREKRALKLARGRVLDIGCGAGRHSLYLQQKGFDVTGMDYSPLSVRLCRARGLKKSLCLPVEKIGGFKADSFDSIIMLGNNFGLFGGFEKARRLLKKMHKITSPRGRIIAETLDPYKTDSPDHLSYHARNRKRGRMGGQVRMRVRYKSYIGPWRDYLFVSQTELEKIVLGTGWRLGKIFTSGGPQYIAVLEKT